MIYRLIFPLFFTVSAMAQSASPELVKYEETRKIKIDSTLELYELKDGLQYLNLMPTVSYDALNQSFNVGVNFSNFANYFQQKQRNKIELATLETRLNDRLAGDLDKLNLEIEQMKIDAILLEDAIELFEIENDLFSIAQGKYDNSEISTEEFLKLKKSYLSQKKSITSTYLRLQMKAKKIALKTESDTLAVSLSKFSNLINNYND